LNGEAEPRLTSGGEAASIASLNDFVQSHLRLTIKEP
jgi:hypothetical protein